MPAYILLVKTSSLGDVVHNFPVVTDIRKSIPDSRVDWVVEDSFSALPKLHPGVDRIIVCRLRKWRRRLLCPDTWTQIRETRIALRERAYDAIVDTQGLLKSALLARLADGPRHGLDWRSSREPLGLLYSRTYSVPWGRHAVTRNRELAALALGYAVAGSPDYGISAPPFPPPCDSLDDGLDMPSYSWVPERPFAVLLHATSAENKLWPEHQWRKLVVQLDARGLDAVIPWGAPPERERADRIASVMPGAVVPPRLDLQALSGLLGRASVCVGVDTGLTHLAAALARPTVGIYTATDPAATGVLAGSSATNVGGPGRPPSLADVITAIESVT